MNDDEKKTMTMETFHLFICLLVVLSQSPSRVVPTRRTFLICNALNLQEVFSSCAVEPIRGMNFKLRVNQKRQANEQKRDRETSRACARRTLLYFAFRARLSLLYLWPRLESTQWTIVSSHAIEKEFLPCPVSPNKPKFCATIC